MIRGILGLVIFVGGMVLIGGFAPDIGNMLFWSGATGAAVAVILYL